MLTSGEPSTTTILDDAEALGTAPAAGDIQQATGKYIPPFLSYYTLVVLLWPIV